MDLRNVNILDIEVMPLNVTSFTVWQNKLDNNFSNGIERNRKGRKLMTWSWNYNDHLCVISPQKSYKLQHTHRNPILFSI